MEILLYLISNHVIIVNTAHDIEYFISVFQATLDSAREAINKPREAFRQKFLEAERRRLDEIAAQEAAIRAEAEAASPKGRKSAKGKKSPGGKKKK